MRLTGCRSIFDKTGTLTYGEPELTEQLNASGFDGREVLTRVASLERYSKYPLVETMAVAETPEFMHISRRMRSIAMQSAVGGMVCSMIGMGFAVTGHLSPVMGSIAQEVIDVCAVLSALRAALPPKIIHDL